MNLIREASVMLALAVLASPVTAEPSQLPGVAKISAANAAGILTYCHENGLLGEADPSAIPNIVISEADKTSVDYIVGSSGQILGDAGRNFSISRAPADMQSQACKMVLNRARSFRTAR